MTRLFVALNVFIYAFILSAVVFVMVLSFSPSPILRFPPEGYHWSGTGRCSTTGRSGTAWA